jgi:hypothetical protein
MEEFEYLMGLHVGNLYLLQATRFLSSLVLIVQRFYFSDYTSFGTIMADYTYVTRWGVIMTAILLACAFFIPLGKERVRKPKGPWKCYFILF